jgi:sugar phosphate isomerase/epimerase
LHVLKIITSVAPYVTIADAFESVKLAHQDGFGGIELSEDHLHCMVNEKPKALQLIREYSKDHQMTNSVHGSLHRPSLDSGSPNERKQAVDYTMRTVDYMESAGVQRLVLHSFSDLPSFFRLRATKANRLLYFAGCHSVKLYALLAPALKEYRKKNADRLYRNFMLSLSQISKYAAEKKVNGEPIEIVFEEHYSDAVDYDAINYGKGKFSNVVRGIDTAHNMIRTREDSDLSGIDSPIHFHAVDTNGIIDDHRTIGNGKVNFQKSLEHIIQRRLTSSVVLEDGTRRSVLASRDALIPMIKRSSMISSSSS